MTSEKLANIIVIYGWPRFAILIFSVLFMCVGFASAQTLEDRLQLLEEQIRKQDADPARSFYIHGILRTKYEYEPELNASRFEVRNARFGIEGALPLRSSYKLEIDLCDESAIQMKDAWIRLNPFATFRITVGQQRMPFSIDAHRNPSAQYFVNRSFIAKQVGNMRDVGILVGYDVFGHRSRKILSLDAGLFNGSNLDNQKNAWFTSPGYSARLQCYPVKGLVLVPSIQHQSIAERKASYTSWDFGISYVCGAWLIETEYLRKVYGQNSFSDCDAFNLMGSYKRPIGQGYFREISYLARYDYMENHASGRSGFEKDAYGNQTERLEMTDAERHRMTLGVTFSIDNSLFSTDLRLNYEKYWYPHGGAKGSEQDKVAVEMVVKF